MYKSTGALGFFVSSCVEVIFLKEKTISYCLYIYLSTKKNAQRENCKLSFIWGKMRTIAQEIAFQVALRNCTRSRVEGQYYI